MSCEKRPLPAQRLTLLPRPLSSPLPHSLQRLLKSRTVIAHLTAIPGTSDLILTARLPIVRSPSMALVGRGETPPAQLDSVVGMLA